MSELPTGTVTFVFTDIEGSTNLLQQVGDDAYISLLGDHHRILRDSIAGHGGIDMGTEGDSFFAVFPDAGDAVAAVLAAQLALGRQAWPGDVAVRVRMGLHTGPGRRGGDGYAGLAVHQAARISAAAHGGQVVASAAVCEAAGVLGEGVSWRPLGRHRLKDLASPIELFQLCHQDLTVELPPLRSLERVAHNLPVQLSSFLGRVEELSLGGNLLESTRLLSLTGPGGTGKTRLAYQLAAEHIDRFPDGVWVAELASVADPALVPAALLTALGLRDEAGRSASQTVVSHLHGRQALVVLDNCEHVIEAAAGLAVELLQGCPGVRVLATSREPLRLSGERVWALGPLGLPAAGEGSPETLAGSDAVALFCERAGEARVGFALDVANAATVREICARLEGIPLALELAAARVRTLPVAQIAERLDRSLDVLSKGARNAADRQASLRGTIAWSHDLLSAAEQVLFRRLGVFVGGFTLEAAEGVCAGEPLGVGEIVDTLDALVDKSLVALVDGGAGGAGGAGDGRYRLLETIRAYATERLHTAGEVDPITVAHAAWYAGLARECAGQTDNAATLARLETEHPNFLAALDHLAAGDPAAHGRLLVDLFPFWDLRGHWRLARGELTRYVERPDADRSLRGRCARGIGLLFYYLGEYAEALGRTEAALGIARELGDRAQEGVCLMNLGNVRLMLGEYDEARECYEDALVIARQVGDRAAEGRCVGNLGNTALVRGDYAEARTRYEEALAMAREAGDRSRLGFWLGALGDVACNLGDYTDARGYFEEALTVSRAAGDRASEGYWVGGLGEVAIRLRDLAGAGDHLTEALAIARELGDRRAECVWLGNLGDLATRLGHHLEARDRLSAAVTIAREVGDRSREGWWTGALGEVAVRSEDYAEARDRFAEALGSARELGDRGNETEWIGRLGMLATLQADVPEARRRFAEALGAARELGRQSSVLLEDCADLLGRQGRWRDATELLAAAEELNVRSCKGRDAWEQARYEATAASCRVGLGAAEFASATEHGRKLDFGGAVDAALGALAALGDG